MSALRALLLDAAGTIVELPPPGPALREELAARFGVDVTDAQAKAAITTEIGFYRRHYHAAGDAESLAALHDRCAEVLRDALPPALSALSTREMVGALLGALRFRCYDDTLPAIRAARAAGLRVVVASNWDVSLHEILERLGVTPWLDGVVTSAELGCAKPAAPVFHRALQLAGGVPPEAALHVGDSPVEDIQGARAAGLRALLIRREGPPGPDVITRLTELAYGAERVPGEQPTR